MKFVAEDLKEDNEKPAVIVMVIGGGGLFCGVCQGLHKVGWNDVPIVVAETFGAHTFNVSVQKGKIFLHLLLILNTNLVQIFGIQENL